MKKFDYLVLCHLFYEDESRRILKELMNVNQHSAFFLFNVNPVMIGKEVLFQDINTMFRNSAVLSIPSKGRDIGAKLQLISLAIQLNIESSYSLIIHDKKSPHVERGNAWRDELLRIISSRNIEKVRNAFERNEEVGIVGAHKFIQNEYNPESQSFASNSNNQIRQVLKKYSVKTSDYSFIAGNIFWIRSELLKNFFKTRSIPDIREELESGNALDFVKGTYVHAWERIMSWIATSQGYKIYGI
jgi:lipopolysaccharide biosynthesis protein